MSALCGRQLLESYESGLGPEPRFGDANGAYPGRRRAAVRPGDEALERFGWSLEDRFDPAVRAVADPAGQSEPLRLRLHGGTVADALYQSVDQQVTRDHSGHCRAFAHHGVGPFGT